MIDAPDLHLGPIGDTILRSRVLLLHRPVDEQNGMHVRYDRLIPDEMSEDFDAVIDSCAGLGNRKVNVTPPYNEPVALLETEDAP